MGGNEIEHKRETSKKSCKKACSKNEHCKGFSFYKKKSECTLRSKSCDHRRGKCLSKKGCFYVKGKVKKMTDRVTRDLAAGCRKMDFGVEYTGKNLKVIDRVVSAVKCNAHCVENAKCQGWV